MKNENNKHKLRKKWGV